MPDTPSQKSTVLSLAKGFRALEAFTSFDPELNLSEIAARAGLDAGTAYRLVKTLVMLGYLRQTPGSKRYRLGSKVLDLGFHAFAGMDLHESARPILRGLVGPSSEAASIGVLENADVLYIERVQTSINHLGVNVRMGSRVPAYCTAIGHAILAHLSPDSRARVLASRERVKLTPRTPVTMEEIEDRLARVRQVGYALSDQDSVVGLRVIAAPILDPDGHPYAGVSVAAPAVAGPLEEFLAACAQPLLTAAGELSKMMRISGAAMSARRS